MKNKIRYFLAILLIIITVLFTGCYDMVGGDMIINGDLTVSGNITTGGLKLSIPVWDDLRFPVNAIVLHPSTAPIWSNVVTPGQTLAFEDKPLVAQEEEISFVVQLPHSWQEGTPVYFHIHYVYPNSIPDTRSLWTLEYDWQNENGLFGLGTHTINLYTDYSDASALKGLKSYFSAIDGAGRTISSIIICSLKRHSSDVSDNYTDNVNLIEIDMHYQINTLGSETQENK